MNWLRPAANLLSLGRGALALVVVHHVTHDAWGPALAWFLVASVTDALDGPLARAGRVRRRATGSSADEMGLAAGAVLDLGADFLLVFPLAAVLAWRGFLPPMVAAGTAASFFMYCAVCAARGAIVRHRLGGSVGAASLLCLGAFLARQWAGLGWLSFSAVWFAMAGALAAASVESGLKLAGYLQVRHRKLHPAAR